MQISTVMKKLSMVTASATLITMGSAGSAAAASLYSITDLGSFGGAPFNIHQTVANDINNAGQVVGWSYDGFQRKRAFLWQNGTMSELNAFSFSALSEAQVINDAGQVAGWISGANSANQSPALWSNSSVMSLGGGGIGYTNQAYGINNAGQVVGSTRPPMSLGIPENGWFWDKGTLTHVGDISFGLYDPYAILRSINDAGQIVGTSSIYGGFLRDKDRTITRLGFAPQKINNQGQILGYSSLWDRGTITDLGISAKDFNEVGQVVGFSSPSGGSQRAFLWENGTKFDLNDLLSENSGWELTEARGINDRGYIIGSGIFNGQNRAFLLTPVGSYEPPTSVPEPVSSFGLLAFGTLGLGAMHKRKRQKKNCAVISTDRI